MNFKIVLYNQVMLMCTQVFGLIFFLIGTRDEGVHNFKQTVVLSLHQNISK